MDTTRSRRADARWICEAESVLSNTRTLNSGATVLRNTECLDALRGGRENNVECRQRQPGLKRQNSISPRPLMRHAIARKNRSPRVTSMR